MNKIEPASRVPDPPLRGYAINRKGVKASRPHGTPGRRLGLRERVEVAMDLARAMKIEWGRASIEKSDEVLTRLWIAADWFLSWQ